MNFGRRQAARKDAPKSFGNRRARRASDSEPVSSDQSDTGPAGEALTKT